MSSPCRHVIVEPSGAVTDTVAEITLEYLQGLVGGYIEALTMLPDGTVGLINEDGKACALPENEPATLILRRSGSFPSDWVAGTLVLLGPADDNGDFTDVTANALAVVAELTG